jgi:hypothetical protein
VVVDGAMVGVGCGEEWMPSWELGERWGSFEEDSGRGELKGRCLRLDLVKGGVGGGDKG